MEGWREATGCGPKVPLLRGVARSAGVCRRNAHLPLRGLLRGRRTLTFPTLTLGAPPWGGITAGTDIFQRVIRGIKPVKRALIQTLFSKFTTELVGIEFEVISQTNPLEHIRPHGVFSKFQVPLLSGPVPLYGGVARSAGVVYHRRCPLLSPLRWRGGPPQVPSSNSPPVEGGTTAGGGEGATKTNLRFYPLHRSAVPRPHGAELPRNAHSHLKKNTVFNLRAVGVIEKIKHDK